jgi:hypothetical protein
MQPKNNGIDLLKMFVIYKTKKSRESRMLENIDFVPLQYFQHHIVKGS